MILASRRIVLSLTLLLVVEPAFAKPKQCFTAKEIEAEQVVRFGLELREGARVCSEPPYNLGLMKMWEEVDQKLGPRFATQKGVRDRAFQREFGNDAINRLEMWNGRIVYNYRYYYQSREHCLDVQKALKNAQAKGWSAISKPAAKAKDDVKMDFRPCP